MVPHTDIGPYAITGVLGQGGMGVVYAGVHRDSGIRAAVKTVSAVQADRIWQIRREIETLARLRHPGVVRILDYSATGGVPWYAMALLDGRTLEEVRRSYWAAPATLVATGDVTRVRGETADTASGTRWAAASGPPVPLVADQVLPPASRPPAGNGHLPEALGLIQRLCDVLAYVHGEGVVHRDLKPSNVFVTPDGLPVLVDFGLVALVGVATGREVLDETRIAGSVKYMAPEQIDGELLDPRTDIYAFGCLVYELLTGRAPFTGDHAQVISQHRHATPRPLSELVTGVPEELEPIVMRMLEKSPRARLSYASDLGARIARLGAQAPAWRGDLPRTGTYLCRPPLVGREAVLRQVSGIVRRLDRRQGGLVFVSGESGVGKTRLALELAWRATASGASVVTGGCLPVLHDTTSGATVQGAPLHPLAPFLQAIADRCTEAGLNESERVVGDRGPVLAAYEPALASVPGQEGRSPAEPLPLAAARERLFRSLTETIAAHVAIAPTLLLLDDLHWADELTLAFLDHLARGPVAGLPLVVLGIWRAEEKNAALQGLLETGQPLAVALTKLSTSAVGDMVAGMLAIQRPPREFVSFLATKSEGNPFFVIEYLRLAVAEQIVVRTPAGEWTFAETTDPTEVLCEALPLPRSLREVITRRLASLSAWTRAAVDCATLIGREFDSPTLQAAIGANDVEMSAAIAELLDRFVIEHAGAPDTYRFAHDKLREIPAAGLDPAERARRHRQIAMALEERPARERREATLGHHWSAAGEPNRAIPHLHRAGDRSQALHALKDAADLYRAALQDVARVRSGQPDADALEEATLREKLADTLAISGAHEQARAEFELAIGSLGTQRPVDSARLQRKIGKTLETLHDHEQALGSYGRAEALLDSVAEDARDPEWRAESIQIRLNRIWVYYWQARIPAMDAELAALAPAVEAHGLALQRSSYFQAIVTRNYRQDRYVVSTETILHARRSLAFALEAHARPEAAFARFVLGFGLLFHGDLAEAETELYEALQETRRLGDATSQLRCLAYLVIMSRRAGRVSDTGSLAAETLSLATAVKMHDYIGVAQAALGWVAWRGDDTEDARRRCQAAFDAWARPSYVYPFQWTGLLTMLAVQASRAPVRELVGLAERMLDAQQMHLPEPITAALESSVTAYRSEGAEQAREALMLAVAEAERLGFL